MRGEGKPELLAPAGGPDQAYAALHYGADAIYVGLTRFSARAEAGNFTLDSLAEVVGYAHSFRPVRKVYVALNTLVREAELGDALCGAGDVAELGVDAVIVQDPGLLRVIRRGLPGLRVHGSTQMAVHNVEGARALAALGVSRVTLARELGLSEIGVIAAGSGLEVEVFIHGALCYSYSGLCLFSAQALGRSGNRGCCAYCCRDRFEVEGAGGESGAGLPFSMKDLAVPDLLPALREAGVASLKIEGRMKSALYVSTVVDYYRRLLDGRLSGKERVESEDAIRSVFSRPWTGLYLEPGRGAVIDPVNVGHRGAAIGVVESVVRDAAGEHWLRFRTSRALEKHDGIQIDLPAESRPFGFGIERLRPAGGPQRPGVGRRDRSGGAADAGAPDGTVIHVSAGTRVDVCLPPDYPRIPAGAPVYCASSQSVKRRYKHDRPKPGQFRRQREVAVRVQFDPDRIEATARCTVDGEVAASVAIAGCFEAARNAAGVEPAVRRAFERTGDTDWRLGALELVNPAGLFAQAAVLNDLRRALVQGLDDSAGVAAAKRKAALAELAHCAVESVGQLGGAGAGVESGPAWSVKVRTLEQLACVVSRVTAVGAELVVGGWSEWGDEVAAAELGRLLARVGVARVRAALPTIVRSVECDRLRRLIVRLAELGVRRWEVGNWGGPYLLEDAVGREALKGWDVSGDWPMYVMNGAAIEQWRALGLGKVVLSPEDEPGNWVALLRRFGASLVVPVLQYTPLFLSESAPLRRDGTTLGVGARLRGRGGHRYAVLREGARTVVVNEVPFNALGMRDEWVANGARELRMDVEWAPDGAAALASLLSRMG